MAVAPTAVGDVFGTLAELRLASQSRTDILIIMPMKLFLTSLALLLSACVTVDTTNDEVTDEEADRSEMAGTAASVDRLNESPRHQEWVQVDNNGKTIYTWVVYPESSDPAPVVLVIHENRGLNDWARSLADQVAEAGYIAVAPDLLSGFSDTMTRTSDFPADDAATSAISELDSEEVMSALQAVADWAKTIPASDGTLVSAGFCWGGARSFEFATENDDLAAALVFYGTGPEDPASYETISAPVFGFYGGADERVNATIDESEAAMIAAGNEYDYVIYDGAGHAFMRSGEDPAADPANIAARNAAWERMKEILADL